MAKNIIDYKCPNCNASLKFNPAKGKFTCEYCESEFAKEDLTLPEEKKEGLYEGDDPDDEANPKEVDEAILFGASRAEDSGQWDPSTISDDWGPDKENIRAYLCPSCGAGLICDSTTVANACPYCGSTTINESDVSGSLKPEYIIPFKITAEQAKQALLDHYKGKFLLPKSFSSENTLKEIKGIYVPFWLFDGESSGAATYSATTTYSYRTSNSTVFVTRHYLVQRGGDIAFKHIPADAAKKMPDDVMDSIEPYDYSKMVPFDMSYLSGFFADKYDVTIDENANRADNRCKNTIRQMLRDTVSGYATVVENAFSASIRRGEVHYAMLPVYMLRTVYRDKEYIFAVNGQTGKTVGDLPADPKRTALGGIIGWAIGSVVTAIILAIAYNVFI